LITFAPVRTERKSSPFVLADLVDDLVGGKLEDGDVLVISSKFVAISEGRIVVLDTVKKSKQALGLSEMYGIPPELCELVIRESDEIIGGVQGFILAIKDGLLTPNAGIDKSNIEHGKVVLYPRNAAESAEILVETMRFRRGLEIGIVIADSRLMPTRRGTVGVAISSAGIDAILDLRGRPDLFGNVLRVTSQAIADDLCSGAQLLMGEADDGVPIVVVKGLSHKLLKKASLYPSESFSIPTDQCLYLRSLGYESRRKVLPAS
jgi:coenzyme F420-0:L-glutamate ligase / coenzyme F420-1:gamma-L-glutamate ligase